MRFFLIFQKLYLVKGWGFCIVFSASVRFFWAIKNSFWKKKIQMFTIRWNPYDLGGVKVYGNPKTWSKLKRKTVLESAWLNKHKNGWYKFENIFLVLWQSSTVHCKRKLLPMKLSKYISFGNHIWILQIKMPNKLRLKNWDFNFSFYKAVCPVGIAKFTLY